MIQFTCGGYDMCGQIRMCWPAQALQSEGETEVMCSRKSFIGLTTTHFYIQRCLQQPIYDGLRKIDSKLYVDFDDSPYSRVHEAAKITNTMTAKNIENNFWSLCDPDLFIEVQNRQYEFMNSRWLENNTERYKQLFKTEQVRI